MDPPIIAKYRINETEWLTLTSAELETNIVPEAKIELVFYRNNHVTITNDTKYLKVGDKALTMNSPPAAKWEKIKPPEEQLADQIIESIKPLLSSAEAFIRDDLAWAIQVMELDVQSVNALAPRFRKNQIPPETNWRNLQKALQSAEKNLRRLQTITKGQTDAQRATIATALSKTSYFRLWADHRGSNPAAPEFIDQLSQYNNSSGTETSHARFSAAVLSDPSDQNAASQVAGLDDLHRWRAHRNYQAFNESGLDRLKSLNTFAERNTVNEYDLRAGFMLTYLTWTDSVLQVIERHESDPNRNIRPLNISDTKPKLQGH